MTDTARRVPPEARPGESAVVAAVRGVSYRRWMACASVTQGGAKDRAQRDDIIEHPKQRPCVATIQILIVE